MAEQEKVVVEAEFEELIGDMADFTAETLAKEKSQEVQKEKAKLTDTMQEVSKMLRSKDFTRKCKEKAKCYGVSEKAIKNIYACNILNTIGNTTGVVLEIVGEAFNYLVRLISFAIQRAVDFTLDVLTKIVNAITFRKEVTE